MNTNAFDTFTKGKPLFSLEELAWFNRCLFPKTLEEGLIEQGVDPLDAKCIMDWYKRNPKVGILGVYQEYASHDEALQLALNKMLQAFLQRPPILGKEEDRLVNFNDNNTFSM